MTMLELSVIIPLYKATAFLPQLVSALEGQTLERDRFEVLLVDDCSPDATLELAENLRIASPLNLRLIGREENGGVSAARNTGWQNATSDLILFVDQDCLPDPDLLATHLAEQRKYAGQAVAVCGRIVWAERYRQDGVAEHYKAVYFPNWDDYQGEGDFWYFITSNASVSKAALEKVGGFDPNFRHNYDDVMCGYRLRTLADCRFVLCPAALVTHDRPLPIDEVIRRNETIGRETVRVLKYYPTVTGQSWLPDPLEVLDGLYWLLSLSYILPDTLNIEPKLHVELIQKIVAYWAEHPRWPDLQSAPVLQTVYRQKLLFQQMRQRVAETEDAYQDLQDQSGQNPPTNSRPKFQTLIRQIPTIVSAGKAVAISQMYRWLPLRLQIATIVRPTTFLREMQDVSDNFNFSPAKQADISPDTLAKLYDLLMQNPMAVGMQNGLRDLFGISSYQQFRAHPQFANSYQSWQDELAARLAPELAGYPSRYRELAGYYRRVETARQRLRILISLKAARAILPKSAKKL